MLDDDRTQATQRVAIGTGKETRPGRLVLQVVVGPDPGARFEIVGTPAKVGRSRMADIQVTHRSISGLHFELAPCAEGALLRDLGSTNGIWFHGRRVDSVVLQPADLFDAGECRFALLDIADIDVDVLELEHFGQLRGSSLAMRELYAQLNALGTTPLDVLILGETGTGKELTARTIHALSGRKGPLVVLDCGALSPTLAEGTIFGFRKGAFTGADRDQRGVFEAADGGTLFIDEVGELPLEIQVKLLRALDNREVTRLGEPGRARKVDVRVIAATHRDLRQAVEDGQFREDLYYRLARALVRTPPLRERGEDVVLLAEEFLQGLREKYEVDVLLSDGAKQALCDHRWPGNVRELRNVVEQAAHIQRTGVLEAPALRLGSTRSSAPAAPIAASLSSSSKGYYEIHADVDRILLARLLDEFEHNLSKLASHLRISRDKLRSRLKELDLYSRPGRGRRRE